MPSNSSPKFTPIRAMLQIMLLVLVALALAGCRVNEQDLAPIPIDTVSQGGLVSQSGPQPVIQPGIQGGVQPGTQAGAAVLAPGTTTPGTGTAPVSQATATAAASPGSIRFTPVIGAPLNAVTPMSRQLALEAERRGLTILSAADPGGEGILKGYFTAFNDDVKTTIIYVWDVLDTQGNRLHRIQGQEEVPGTSADPWSLVPAATMEKIATRTMDEYSLWRNGPRG